MKKVLIVEDDSLLGHYFQTSLTNAGFNVQHVVSAADTYDAIKKDRPDLILLDLMLPEIDGFEILKYLKEQNLENIPVVVVSNLGDQDSVTRAMGLGAVYYFIKANVVPQDIIAKMKEILG